ncbi:helix-turn-helix transcriptional regulator [Ruegeria atlantica]|uniref:helix-turn-helix transcriptional regulator n=1 Tax=Ruegeria atlantica TaxID=81569 RepID=UPI003D7C48E1
MQSFLEKARTQAKGLVEVCQVKPKGALAPAFLSEKQTASYLNMSVQWLRKCRSNGSGPKWKKFGQAIRYPIADLQNYISQSSRQFAGQDVERADQPVTTSRDWKSSSGTKVRF